MFELIFGLFFAGMPTVMLFTLTKDVASEGVPFSVYILFVSVFFLTGAMFFWQGVKRIKKNLDTKIHGYIGYGEVISIDPTGTLYNHKPELAATVRAFIPKLNIIISLSDVVGIGSSPYELGSIVEVKYYNYDINIQRGVEDKFSLPRRVQEVLLGRAVLSEEENRKDWDKVDTENWTLSPDAFPEDLSFDRLKDGSDYLEDENPPMEIKVPTNRSGFFKGNLFREFLGCIVVYAVVVVLAMIVNM